MNRVLVAAVVLVAVLSVGIADAAGPPVPWTKKDMTAAIRAIGYPKPHAKKLACHGLGTIDTAGRYTSFRCVATYRHSVRRRFVVGGVALGGWVCAGKTLTTCKTLRHGFVATDQLGPLPGVAEFAARGYMKVRYGIAFPNRSGACTQGSATVWTCGYYATDTTVANVTVTLKAAKGGYLIGATATT